MEGGHQSTSGPVCRLEGGYHRPVCVDTDVGPLYHYRWRVGPKTTKQTEDARHSLYSHEPVNKHLKSRNSFVHFVTPLDTNPPAERMKAWTHHLPSKDLCPGSETPWLHWKCLNRLRTGMGRCKLNMEIQ